MKKKKRKKTLRRVKNGVLKTSAVTALAAVVLAGSALDSERMLIPMAVMLIAFGYLAIFAIAQEDFWKKDGAR